MNLLLRQATIVDPASPHNGHTTDIHILAGRIEAIGEHLQASGAEVIEGKGAWCSPGWLDFGTQGGDPGLEHREDFNSLSEAALAGGYTTLVCAPNTDPPLHSKSEIAYLMAQNRRLPVQLLPLGAASMHCQGKDITEMLDMRAAGAVAFGDGHTPIANSGLMLRALQYATAFDGIIVNRPSDAGIAGGGQLHEGAISTRLGLRGIPALAEQLMTERDLHLLEYTGSRLHLWGLSTRGAVEMVRRAKKAGLRVTASVAALNLLFTDEVLGDFNENFKVLPPLRSEDDREALLEGLEDGTLDFIFSNHLPLDTEAKDREFPYADFGAIGLQTAAAALHTHLGLRFSPQQWIKWLALRPREIFGLPAPSVQVGVQAWLTLFQPNAEWTFQREHILSKSHNSPLIGQSFKGRVWATISGPHYRKFDAL
ncbi:MAG TPA: dihydroorotase [Saprospiraceae bacterium]|nr:dihydroorotase [Saprospiraceae bacterium]